jgi:hypothetical protein
VIGAQIELLQRRIAEVDPRAVLLFQSILAGMPVELVLERIILINRFELI